MFDLIRINPNDGEGIKNALTLTLVKPSEDDGEPIAAMFVKTDGWLIEPHVEFFAGTTPAAIFRSYLHFFGSLVKEGIEGTCVIKAFKENRKLFDKLAAKGVLHYVGEIPFGDPKGTLYQYCLLHKRSQS